MISDAAPTTNICSVRIGAFASSVQHHREVNTIVTTMSIKSHNTEHSLPMAPVGRINKQRHTLQNNKYMQQSIHITKTRLLKCIENFTSKNWKILDKKLDTFLISAQNIVCGYTLELPLQGSSYEYPQSMFLSCRGSSNVYPQTMFWAEIRKIMYSPVLLY